MTGAELIGYAKLLDQLGSYWSGLVGGRPQVQAVAEPFFGGRRYLFLSIRNPTKFTIRLTSITVDPDRFQVMSGTDVNSAASALVGEPASGYVEAEQEARFPIVLRSVSEENRDLLCGVFIYWRSLRDPNIPQVRVVYRITVSDLEALQEG